MNYFRTLMLYYYTLRSLKLIQIVGRFFYSKKMLVNEQTPEYSVFFGGDEDIVFLEKHGSHIVGSLVYVLENEIRYTDGWYPKLDTLIVYNLHYFNYIHSLDSCFEDVKCAIIDWIDNVPRQNDIAWEPYVVSVRVVNWIKWLVKYNVFDKRILDSLYIQCRYLRKNNEFHLLGNHYFENAKAIYMASLLFSGKEVQGWLFWSEKVISKQIDEQILEDGAHFERSPMYHAIMLENIYDILIYSECAGHNNSLHKKLSEKSVGMLNWLKSITHKDGSLPKFNDCSVTFAPSVFELSTLADSLGLNHVLGGNRSFTIFKESGFLSFDSDLYKTIVDFGSIGPSYLKGHGHSENFSFELSVNKKRLFVNHGVGTYQEGEQRLFERSSLAHNTVSLDGKSSNELWKSFRVGRTSNISNLYSFSDSIQSVFSATQDGYQKLYSGPLHSRTFRFRENMFFIEDRFEGSSCHTGLVVINFYISSGWNVEKRDGLIIIKDDFNQCTMKPPSSSVVNIDKVIIYDSWYHSVEGWNISFSLDLENNSCCLTEINIINENN